MNKKKKAENTINFVDNKDLLKRYIQLIVGLLIYAIAYNSFFVTNNLVYGGSSSVATLLKEYINPYYTIAFISVFSLILNYLVLGKKSFLNSLIGSLLYPLFVLLTSDIKIPIPKDDMMLVAICGAVLIGLASGIIERTGFSSGGLDSIIQIVAKKLKISSGHAFMYVNALIVLIGGYKFGWRILLYALIILYIISIVTDKVVMSISMNKTFFIVTNKVEEVKQYILNNLSRGVTVLDAKGGFTHHDQEVIMAVIPTTEYFKTKEGILKIDPNAFFTIMDSYQVYGQDSHRKKRWESEDTWNL